MMHARPDNSGVPSGLLAVTLVGGVGQLFLGAGFTPHKAILPLGLAVSVAVARPWRRWRPSRESSSPAAWLLAAWIAASAVAIAWGCVATTDRSWDGFATWSLTARHLSAGETLASPYFADASVFHYVRGYPLLQPVLLQQCSEWLGGVWGRLWFVFAWLLLLRGVAGATRAGGGHTRTVRFAVAGAALTPMFLEPGGGSAESGFADLLVAAVTVYGAQATLCNGRWIALCVGLLLPVTKNEGLLHLSLWIATSASVGHWRSALGLVLGGAASLAWWLPLQQGLIHPANPATFSFAALSPILALLAAVTAGAAIARFGARALVLLMAVPLAAACLLPGSALREPGSWATGLQLDWTALPQVTGELVAQVFDIKRFGATFLLLAAASIYELRRRRQTADVPVGGQALAWNVAIVAAAIAGFMLVVPLASRALFIREGIPRYLGQTLGVAWASIGILLSAWIPQPEHCPDARRVAT